MVKRKLSQKQKLLMKRTTTIVKVTRNWVSNGTSLKYIKNGDHVFQDLLGKKKFFTKFLKLRNDNEIINFIIANVNSPWYDLATNKTYAEIISDLILLDYDIIKREKTIKKKGLSKKSKQYKNLKKEERLYDKTLKNLRKALGLKKKESVPNFDTLNEFNEYSKNERSSSVLSDFGYVDAFDIFDVDEDEDDKYELRRHNNSSMFDIFEDYDDEEDEFDEDEEDYHENTSAMNRRIDNLAETVQSLVNALSVKSSVAATPTGFRNFDVEDEEDDEEEEIDNHLQSEILRTLTQISDRQDKTDEVLRSVIDLIMDDEEEDEEIDPIPNQERPPTGFRMDTTEEIIAGVNSIKNSDIPVQQGVIIDTDVVEATEVSAEV